jgi:hypothetical protein
MRIIWDAEFSAWANKAIEAVARAANLVDCASVLPKQSYDADRYEIMAQLSSVIDQGRLIYENTGKTERDPRGLRREHLDPLVAILRALRDGTAATIKIEKARRDFIDHAQAILHSAARRRWARAHDVKAGRGSGRYNVEDELGAAEENVCTRCEVPLQESVTGSRRTEAGGYCSDCYFKLATGQE